jgi:hypothetical protein
VSSGLAAALGCVCGLLFSFDQGFNLIEYRPLLQRREALEHPQDPRCEAIPVNSSIFGSCFLGKSLSRVEEFFKRDIEGSSEHSELWG